MNAPKNPKRLVALQFAVMAAVVFALVGYPIAAAIM